MRILVIGGKKFAGYAIVQEALSRGHDVTLFNRGQTYPELFADLPCVIGDRDTGFDRLRGMTFDAVIDPSCYFPHQMRAAADFFRQTGAFYVLISTISVCDIGHAPVREDDPLPAYDFESTSFTPGMGNYGPLKAACESILLDAFGAGAAIVRPGFICGDRDHTDRFTYWPMKMHFSDEILVPEGDFPFQFIDVRDLAAFVVTLAERRAGGIYSATGPDRPYRFSDFLADCRAAVNPRCRLVRVSWDQLKQWGLDDLDEAFFPLFIPPQPGFTGLYEVDVSRAVSAGLTFRPARDTILAALDWYLSTGKDGDSAAAGLPLRRERDLLSRF